MEATSVVPEGRISPEDAVSATHLQPKSSNVIPTLVSIGIMDGQSNSTT